MADIQRSAISKGIIAVATNSTSLPIKEPSDPKECAECVRLRRLNADLLAACKLAVMHVQELRDAWQSGAISEHDGLGGTRSNRNVQVDVSLRAAITKATT